jgi:hypothetical protein
MDVKRTPGRKLVKQVLAVGPDIDQLSAIQLGRPGAKPPLRRTDPDPSSGEFALMVLGRAMDFVAFGHV